MLSNLDHKPKPSCDEFSNLPNFLIQNNVIMRLLGILDDPEDLMLIENALSTLINFSISNKYVVSEILKRDIADLLRNAQIMDHNFSVSSSWCEDVVRHLGDALYTCLVTFVSVSTDKCEVVSETSYNLARLRIYKGTSSIRGPSNNLWIIYPIKLENWMIMVSFNLN